MTGGNGTVVVGGGQAGAEVVFALRAAGYHRPITLLCGEPHLPYERPPLSKGVLTGETDPARLLIRAARAYAGKDIDIRLDTRVVRVDRRTRTVHTESGDSLPFDSLILATGADAIRPPWSGTGRVHTIRTLDDVRAVRPGVGDRVAVIGGGFLGLEVASSLSALVASVTVVESAGRVLPGRVSEFTAGRIRGLHEQRGIRFVLGARVGRIFTTTAPVVELGDGRRVEADWVVLSIGAAPRDELARDCGLATARGILVDTCCRTSDPDIYAIGDVAVAPATGGTVTGIESVASALSQARIAAATITGTPAPAPRPETFWSEQFGTQLRIAGVVDAGGEVTDSVTEFGDGGFVVRRTRDGALVAVETFGNPKEFALGLRELTTTTTGR
ncbi:NAD(P)/FAD-dependent oxidoreductase [Nocardia flavorosea]|uniref:FAD-dependent oxidoreductase n=1 Tax=Nocardia flavorosea TaxID=53429 RepID=A0A846YP19_9NOCA|nr:FAD-dependent oxidoreductase [Nocardia flavorosea]NKY59461.1 FAD-dependent oxidoreductase [Nocardia flavorosea]